MKFNGIDLADRYASAGGYFIVNDVRGRGVIGSEVDMIDVPGRDGSYVIGKRRPPRALEVDITLKGDSYEDLRKKIEDLNALLSTETDAEIVFDDEPDRVYYGRLAEVNDKLEKSKIYQATLTFICPDPYKYGPLRTQTINVPPASFSRNSIAYLSDGTQVAANQPRFEQGGVLVEEGTVNLIPSALAKNLTSAWTSGNLNGTYTLSVRGGTGQVNISGGYTGSVAVGQTLTFSVANKTITLTPANGTPQFVQLEQKPYATSFVDGTRQPETLTLPTDGVLDPREGTVEFWFKPDWPNSDTITRVIFAVEQTYPNVSTTKIFARWSSVTFRVNGVDLQIPSSSLFNKAWNYFALVWQSNGSFNAYLNGSKVGTGTYTTVPAWTTPIYVGANTPNGIEQANGLFGPLRISRIARSDAEIIDAYQNGFTVDEYTTAYLPFDGSLEVQTPTIVTNEGTAETYPTFTAYVKQPITFLDIISPDSYMRVGQPYEVSQTPVDGEKPVMQDKMQTTTGWGAASSVVDGIVQGTMVSDGERFVVQSYGPTYNGWAGPSLKKSLPYAVQDFRMYSLIQIHSSAKGTGRIEIYGLDTANNIVFRATIADFWPNTKMVRLQCELGTSRDMAWMTYGKKKGDLNYYYGAIDIRRKGNRWEFYTARVDNTGHLVDFVRYTYIDTKNKYTAPLAQLQVHIGCHMSYGPVDHMSINHLYVYELRDHQENQVPYIAYPDDVLQFDHKNAVIYRNGEPIMAYKDFGARFFPLAPGATELAVNPSDAAVVTIEYRPRYK